jgi:hypothetical protein
MNSGNYFYSFDRSAVLFHALGLGFVLFGFTLQYFLLGNKSKSFVSQHVESKLDTIYQAVDVQTVDMQTAEADVKDNALYDYDDRANNSELEPEIMIPLMYEPMRGPPPRIGCSMAIDNDSGILAICGGLGTEKILSDACIYVSCVDTWISLSENGPRFMYANMFVNEGRLYLFGGIDDSSEPSSALYGYDFDSKEWVSMLIKSEECPPARFNASLCEASRGHFLLFGGRGQSGILYNDVWVLIVSEAGCMWERLDITSLAEMSPLPREAHSAAIVSSDSTDIMLIFGGCSDGNESLEDDTSILAFDISSRSWVHKEVVGDGPHPSALVGGSAHCMGEGGAGKILVVAGFDIHSSQKMTVSDTKLSELQECSSDFVSDTFNALYVLDTSEEPYVWLRTGVEWVGGGDATMPPGSRSFFGSAMDAQNGLLYIFGGLGHGLMEGKAQGGLCTLDCSVLTHPEKVEAEEVMEDQEEMTTETNLESHAPHACDLVEEFNFHLIRQSSEEDVATESAFASTAVSVAPLVPSGRRPAWCR